MTVLPIIDIAALSGSGSGGAEQVARAIDEACREAGFFYITGHGVEASLIEGLEQLSREFFACPLEQKRELAMARAGRAWRGYFAVGDELTSGIPDQKEGIYFGSELDSGDPRCVAGLPLHGANLFPAIPGFRAAVLAYFEAMTELGHRLVEGLSLALGRERGWFRDQYTQDPLLLFRIFNYPPLADPSSEQQWSVGEHSDYGLLTILHQDPSGGLAVKSQGEWIEAPPIPGTFVCNLGDMLDRMTSGRYRSTPHRVRNRAASARLSLPFFFDPSWDAEIQPLDPSAAARDDRGERWDRESVHLFQGSYGDYLLRKVARVFPELERELG